MEGGPDVAARLDRIELRDIRVFATAELEPDPEATTVLVGPNGSGKTTFLESIAYLGTQRSFRTTFKDAMVRAGAATGVIRGEMRREGRPLVVEAELVMGGPGRTLVNHQAVRARRELARTVPVTVFSPGDLAVVQGVPLQRRDLLDEALRIVDLGVGAALDELDRVLRQRGALLRQAHGRLSSEIATTLGIWDERLVRAGTAAATARQELLASVAPLASVSYGALSGGRSSVTATYHAAWATTLAAALDQSRTDDVRRGVSTVGPHRDDVRLVIDGRDARTQASQGEQRSLALALRLAVHAVITQRTGAAPILLLDDVFSELDDRRSGALVRLLPAGQSLLTTATGAPRGVAVAKLVEVGADGGST